MSIKWYQPKQRVNCSIFGDFFSLSRKLLRFSDESREKYFKNMQHLTIGYDESCNTIYLRPNDSNEGYKISKEKTCVGLRIRWEGFLKANSIHFEKPCSIKILPSPHKDIYCLNLKGSQG